MKFFVRTFGCKMNLLDTARVVASLREAGHEQVQRAEQADMVLVNTCTVTSESERKSRRAVRSAQRDGQRVAVFGCGPRAHGEAWKQAVGGAQICGSEAELLSLFGAKPAPRASITTLPTRLLVPIQYGCDNGCTFCATRLARGAHRTVPREEVLETVRAFADSGGGEVVLSGINLAAWGCSISTHPWESELASLLTAILEQTTIERIRLSSLGPEYLDPRFFKVFRDERICDHLHLSVQSGSFPVLQAMGRNYTVQDVEEIARQARRVRPDTAITADFIVGFPGETEEYFLQTLELVERVQFARLHVFPFSPREATAAYSYPDQVSEEDKRRRTSLLTELGHACSARFHRSQQGKTVRALKLADGTSLTSHGLRLRTTTGRQGQWVQVRIEQKDIVSG
ncbi:MAG TPA: MiaB/RimO family radical SAM methylthiotransferase [Polyangiaceae bacterium]|nr:MiaB/RimO family radical SAM methylthiotransferase [Polyangiaceae bacterium]HNZ25339.1 MiaB/RimO family radical SAM methylthiotransferase [Polyangiaceae bacterium]HOD23101.1 MiaB/RimO family radical SAM methylthiotransferase [Polyangiaceae bacterium]HOE50374.1 MiaB/RimO family radical SAM methylthiotransferase [Polyangiaceae bacterium]HOH03160.1 MiaB/RimO family radical SAM methylthiotransferase [Polyangiaceae bacterium]